MIVQLIVKCCSNFQSIAFLTNRFSRESAGKVTYLFIMVVVHQWQAIIGVHFISQHEEELGNDKAICL